SENFDEGGGEYNPDFWLLASLDGERFLIDDIDDPTDGPTSLATNGTRLLLQSGTDWILRPRLIATSGPLASNSDVELWSHGAT
ncbi:MAG: hypothetical protein LH616_02255, partial [Ilumatobacteraceae bacterium]|nr:hypothetical protein [Ilumatobacteraceae bacterium]